MYIKLCATVSVLINVRIVSSCVSVCACEFYFIILDAFHKGSKNNIK